MQLITERLTIYPLTPEELRLWLDAPEKLEKALGCKYDADEVDPVFHAIIAGQAKLASADPDNYLFHTFWWMIEKESRTVVGSCDYKAPPENGRVEIGYGLGENHRHKGYMTETVNALCEFAFSQPGIDEVIAETETGNPASQRVLKRCGFTLYKRGETFWWSRRSKESTRKTYPGLEDETPEINAFWGRFLKATGKNIDTPFCESFYFGLDSAQADELLELVLDGKKTATSSALPAYEIDGDRIPCPGDLSVVTDFSGKPFCVIETIATEIIPFKEMTFDTCRREGEDDCLESWREKHIRFFNAESEEIGYEFCESMPVLFEDFRVVYKEG